ncbi:unnamed protein product [Rhizophagus irregularis]|uniref:HMG box domain-containing protein n=1 Tax=Rhizophagus irregularis TaxID=588596 RepID=A0A915ZEU2_9GLOM|nr:unnamed protein product [Rhizophagus irregularis]
MKNKPPKKCKNKKKEMKKKKNNEKKRDENSFFIFKRLARDTLNNHYSLLNSKQQAKESGKFWRYIPDELKNKFFEHANRKRLLDNTEVISYITHNHPTEELRVILDDRCLKSNFSSSGEEYHRTSDDYTTKGSLSPEDEEYNRIFDDWISITDTQFDS